MKILLITYDNCDDSEVLYPYFRMLEEGCEVDVASLERRTINAKYHFKIDAGLLPEEINAADYDGLILPGGTAPEKLRQNQRILDAVSYMMDKGLPVASICHGQQILISTGRLKGRTATCYPGIRDDLINAGANYVNERVVVDGNLVTSRRPEDLPYFMGEFVKLLRK
ncbi:MAG: type 1 glutamine amidotransferase [Clostridia bacterium]|nr:type 1 glutamine amidotransferase [Clostridia bacterium]